MLSSKKNPVRKFIFRLGLFIAAKCVKSQNHPPFYTIKHNVQLNIRVKHNVHLNIRVLKIILRKCSSAGWQPSKKETSVRSPRICVRAAIRAEVGSVNPGHLRGHLHSPCFSSGGNLCARAKGDFLGPSHIQASRHSVASNARALFLDLLLGVQPQGCYRPGRGSGAGDY